MRHVIPAENLVYIMRSTLQLHWLRNPGKSNILALPRINEKNTKNQWAVEAAVHLTRQHGRVCLAEPLSDSCRDKDWIQMSIKVGRLTMLTFALFVVRSSKVTANTFSRLMENCNARISVGRPKIWQDGHVMTFAPLKTKIKQKGR